MSESIIIDVTHLGASYSTGVENYVASLLPPLSEILISKGYAVTWIGNANAPGQLPQGVPYIQSPYSTFWSQTGLKKALDREKPSLFFTPSGIPPLLYKGSVAITVHDMGAYYFSQAYTFSQMLRLRFLLKIAAKRAVRILVPSTYTASTLASLWNIPRERINLTPLGFAPPKIAPEEISGIPKDLPIIVFTGRIEFKKNLSTVVRGFATLLKTQDAVLVLAGKDGFGSEELRREIELIDKKVRDRIILTGYLSDGQKEWLLRNAAIAVVPGKAEGFGIPVLEAFAAGVPLVCAQAGSLPEVGGDAVLYAAPDLPEEWTAQMLKLLHEPDLRSVLVAKGKARLKQFDWRELPSLPRTPLYRLSQTRRNSELIIQPSEWNEKTTTAPRPGASAQAH